MNKSIEIWGRTFNIPVDFDCYDNEEISDLQLDAIKEFEISKDEQNKRKAKAQFKNKRYLPDEYAVAWFIPS